MKNWLYAVGVVITGVVVCGYYIIFETEIENVYAQPTAYVDSAMPGLVERWEMY